jgi:hypothetical protein
VWARVVVKKYLQPVEEHTPWQNSFCQILMQSASIGLQQIEPSSSSLHLIGQL